MKNYNNQMPEVLHYSTIIMSMKMTFSHQEKDSITFNILLRWQENVILKLDLLQNGLHELLL